MTEGRIGVAGGTGLVGRFVVDALRAAGRDPVVIARAAGVDLTTGRGLDTALAEVSAVIDVSNIVTIRTSAAQEFFATATRHLMAAEQRAGVRHHVLLSIVGVDRVWLGYYAAKSRQEELALAGPVPATVLRATQFHEFADQFASRRLPVALAPRMTSQPVAAREVAQRLVELADQAPQAWAPDLAGPRREQMPDLVRRLLRSRGQHRPVLAVPLPGRAGRAVAAGGLLPTGPGLRGQQTFEDWLGGPDRDRGRTG